MHTQFANRSTVAVMKINGLLCKVIFDQNPTNEFYVEESFPLDWMYNYETPFGVIMKINRQPVTELSTEVMDRDHAFWTNYTTRLCGNWITYDTTVKQIADFVERTYIQNNYKGFTGNRAFVRDDDAQKAFSKLRSSQAGMYFWRWTSTCPPEYRQKSAAAQEALRRETDFAFYSGLFGWTKGEALQMGPVGTYQIFSTKGQQSGGMMKKMDQEPAAHWLYYITVDAIDAAQDRVKSAGGQVIHGPMQVPGGSWIINGLDPQGAMFALVAPKK